MAGAGKRFKDAGYEKPKPLIDVLGKPMIQRVIENLGTISKNDEKHSYIFLVNEQDFQEHFKEFMNILDETNISADIIPVKRLTEGAAATCLLAKEKIDPHNPVVVANCDQIVKNDLLFNILDEIENKLYQPISTSYRDVYPEGVIVTFKSNETKHSYVKITNFNDMEFISKVAEKKVISDDATVGIYAWKYGSDFIESLETMIERNIRTNNEFYLAPSYNILIERKRLIVPFEIDSPRPIGTPEDLQKYIKYMDGY